MSKIDEVIKEFATYDLLIPNYVFEVLEQLRPYVELAELVVRNSDQVDFIDDDYRTFNELIQQIKEQEK